MKRLTEKGKDGCYTVPGGDMEGAVQRLGAFEDACEALMKSQEQIPGELDALRVQGKEKTVRFKETMAQKLINNNIIIFLKRYGLL